MLRKNDRVIPVLRINNRQVNQAFFEQNLGMKTLLEEGPFVELGAGLGDGVQLVLQESPAYRTRSVQGLKKLQQIHVKVAQAGEIESLLARGASYQKLYQGKKGLAFQSQSPEGDVFLLHAEDSVADLTEILPPVALTGQEDFKGLTAFELEAVVINSPDTEAHQTFYQTLFPDLQLIQFCEATGEDLSAEAEVVWDLTAFRFPISQEVNWTLVEEQLNQPYFKDRKERFLQTTDPSGIEVWLEK